MTSMKPSCASERPVLAPREWGDLRECCIRTARKYLVERSFVPPSSLYDSHSRISPVGYPLALD